MTTTSERIERLATLVEVPHEDDGTPATLQALLPCEPAIGEVAVACWSDSDGGELIELVRLDDGRRVPDKVALREALTLLAMVETLEELAAFDELAPLADALSDWHADTELPDGFARARAQALEALEALAGLAPDEGPRVARPQLLDQLGMALRDLEHAWQQLEQQAEIWSDALLGARPDDTAAVEQVQVLWRLLAIARRGPLSQPPSMALQAGREAGAAMATAVFEAQG